MTDGARAVGRVLALDGPDGYTGAMSFRSILTSFGLSVLLSTLVSGDEFPDSAEAFPPSAELPDLFTFRDGGAVSGREDWGRRRDELVGLLMHYQYGTVPPKPDLVTARVGSIREHPSGLGTVNELTLMIGSEAQLPVRAVLYKPVTPGPHPVIIKEEGRVGRSRYAPLFLEKNYILIEYANGDLDPGREGSAGPAQVAFPGYDWGMLAAWAWGGMRVVDYLESRGDIDMGRIAITGHSRGGKAILLAAALDERIALAAPVQSGAGGAGCSKILGPGAESIGMNDKPHWYHPRILMFAGKEAHLPFDQHFLKALVAPRSLICIESADDLFANPIGTYATSLAARPAFELFDRGAHNAIQFRRGGHSFSGEDWQLLLEFAEWAFFGRQPDGRKMPVFAPPEVAPESGRGGKPEFVRIGDPGNAGDVAYPRVGSFGAVPREFEIGKYKVSKAEYAAFLNAVARDGDPDRLYDPAMGISRGTTGNFSVQADQADTAVTHVDWIAALQFCNWRHGGDPERGAYDLTTGERQPGAKVFLPTGHEWYKAAYYDPEDGKYHLEPFRNAHKHKFLEGLWLKSSYGMLGAGDPIWEWTESKQGEQFRGLRSDSWFQGNNGQAKGHFYSNPDLRVGNIGFRVARAVSSARAAEGWELLFNGRDLDGWRANKYKHEPEWNIVDGVLVGHGGQGYLSTLREFGDFELLVEARISDTGGGRGNSGVYFRCAPHLDKTREFPPGYEAQLDHGDQNNPTGSIYALGVDGARAPRSTAKDGEWVTLKIRAQGNHLQTWVDGKPAADCRDPEARHRKGSILLQMHHRTGKVEFRKIAIREIGDG